MFGLVVLFDCFYLCRLICCLLCICCFWLVVLTFTFRLLICCCGVLLGLTRMFVFAGWELFGFVCVRFTLCVCLLVCCLFRLRLWLLAVGWCGSVFAWCFCSVLCFCLLFLCFVLRVYCDLLCVFRAVLCLVVFIVGLRVALCAYLRVILVDFCCFEFFAVYRGFVGVGLSFITLTLVFASILFYFVWLW